MPWFISSKIPYVDRRFTFMWWKIILYYIFTFLTKNFGTHVTHRDFWQLKPLNLSLEQLTDSIYCVSHGTRHQIFIIFYPVWHRWRWNNLSKLPSDINFMLSRKNSPSSVSFMNVFSKNLVPDTIQNTIKWIC